MGVGRLGIIPVNMAYAVFFFFALLYQIVTCNSDQILILLWPRRAKSNVIEYIGYKRLLGVGRC